jgi:hypothetical protein
MPKKAKKVPTLADLNYEAMQIQGLKVTVTIPTKAVPLFKALAEISEYSFAGYGSMAIMRYMTSEESMKVFDDLINELS